MILLFLMLPHNNNYYSYQTLPNQGNYTFDLKVNVDFNNGRVNLNVPPPPAPFQKKPEIPVIYTQQNLVSSRSPYNSQHTAQPQVLPTYHVVQPMWQPVPNYVRTEPIYNSAHPMQIDQSNPVRYSDKYQAKSSTDTYPDSYSSFSAGIQKSMEAVECVICDKPISRDHFHAHLQEHKGRRRQNARKDVKPQYETEKVGSFSIRNQNSLADVADLYRQIPSRVSRQQPNNVSQQISDTQSRIVYAPRDPSRVLNSHHQSQQYQYSLSSGQTNLSQQSNQMVKINKQLSQPNLSTNSFNQRTPSIVQQNSRSSNNMLPVELSRRQQPRSISQNRIQVQQQQPQRQDMSRSSSVARDNRVQNSLRLPNNTSNLFDISKTESMILKPQKKQYGSLQNLDQSAIHKVMNISRQSSINQLRKKLNIQQIQEEGSSSDQEIYYSVKVNPSSKAYQSVSRSKQTLGMDSSSNNTEKMSRTKLPVNYLAREQFIVNNMYNSCYYRSRHSKWN